MDIVLEGEAQDWRRRWRRGTVIAAAMATFKHRNRGIFSANGQWQCSPRLQQTFQSTTTPSLRHWRTFCPNLSTSPCQPCCPKVRISLKNAVDGQPFVKNDSGLMLANLARDGRPSVEGRKISRSISRPRRRRTAAKSSRKLFRIPSSSHRDGSNVHPA